LARKDAERGARAVLAYLDTLESESAPPVQNALKQLPTLDKNIVDREDLEKLWRAEQKIAAQKGQPGFKFGSIEEMLRVIEET